MNNPKKTKKEIAITEYDARRTRDKYTLFGGNIGREISYGVFFLSEIKMNPECDVADVWLQMGSQEYWGSFITLRKIQECLNKNR